MDIHSPLAASVLSFCASEFGIGPRFEPRSDGSYKLVDAICPQSEFVGSSKAHSIQEYQDHAPYSSVGGPAALQAKGKGKGKSKGKEKGKPTQDQSWDIEYLEENPFWWHTAMGDLCFELPMTSEDLLTDGAPPSQQWWDVDKLSESDAYFAVTKPAGMAVITEPEALFEALPNNFVHVAHERFDIPSKHEPRQRGICHRLDCNTSGVQIFGKTWEAFTHFAQQNTAHRMHKEYVCLVHGRLGGPNAPNIGMIDVPMVKWQDFSRREHGSIICAKEGRPAVSKYKVLRQWRVPATGKTKFWGKDRWFSLVQMRILTGRTHQIRVHMAFIGHPLVGDERYNPACYAHDMAIVPRIFLHCLRMEFADMDDSMFCAVSDLALDLQVALHYIASIADPSAMLDASNSEGTPFPNSLGLPTGLARFLEATKEAAPPELPVRMEGDSKAWGPTPIVQKNPFSREMEESSCTMLNRKEETALVWKLETSSKAATPANDSNRINWGPDVLWMPTGLRQKCAEMALEESELLEALPEDLGADWGSFGPKWAWAHDGMRQNGWLHLHSGGVLASKWGSGTWRLLHDCEPALLLATFHDVEHGLRLTGLNTETPGFDMVSKRRLNFSTSLEDEIRNGTQFALDVLAPHAPPCCATRGWPVSS